MESKEKEARFDLFCRYCKFNSLLGSEDPCNECLNSPSNEDSHRPVLFKRARPILNFFLPDGFSYTPDVRKAKNWDRWPTDQEVKQNFELREGGDYWEKGE